MRNQGMRETVCFKLFTERPHSNEFYHRDINLSSIIFLESIKTKIDLSIITNIFTKIDIFLCIKVDILPFIQNLHFINWIKPFLAGNILINETPLKHAFFCNKIWSVSSKRTAVRNKPGDHMSVCRLIFFYYWRVILIFDKWHKYTCTEKTTRKSF